MTQKIPHTPAANLQKTTHLINCVTVAGMCCAALAALANYLLSVTGAITTFAVSLGVALYVPSYLALFWLFDKMTCPRKRRTLEATSYAIVGLVGVLSIFLPDSQKVAAFTNMLTYYSASTAPILAYRTFRSR